MASPSSSNACLTQPPIAWKLSTSSECFRFFNWAIIIRMLCFIGKKTVTFLRLLLIHWQIWIYHKTHQELKKKKERLNCFTWIKEKLMIRTKWELKKFFLHTIICMKKYMNKHTSFLEFICCILSFFPWVLCY